MSVTVSGAANKPPHPTLSSRRETACQNSSVRRLTAPPRRLLYPPALSRTGMNRREADRKENEHLHLNGMFFFVHLFGNDLRPFCLLLASVWKSLPAVLHGGSKAQRPGRTSHFHETGRGRSVKCSRLGLAHTQFSSISYGMDHV